MRRQNLRYNLSRPSATIGSSIPCLAQFPGWPHHSKIAPINAQNTLTVAVNNEAATASAWGIPYQLHSARAAPSRKPKPAAVIGRALTTVMTGKVQSNRAHGT